MTTKWLVPVGAAVLLAACASVDRSTPATVEQAGFGSEGEAIAAELGYRVPRGAAQQTMGSGPAMAKPAGAP
jgi:hypothetical protein